MLENIQNIPIDSEGNPNPRGILSSRLGMYVHLPFCRSKCHYCGFVSGPPRADEEIDAYVSVLLSHLESGVRITGDRVLSSIYIGGGTPSFVGSGRLVKLFGCITKHYLIDPNAEITLEANPESMNEDLIRQLKPFGLNRISLGAQSFDDRELERLGRIHTSARIHEAVNEIRNGGIDNLSLDLMFALPGQSLPQCRENLRQVMACNPEHISVYGLSFEKGTTLERWRNAGKIIPVLDETYIEMYDIIRNDLEDAGWPQYEISNWSRPGRTCQHNLLYWDRGDYLAFGASAHGMIDGIRFGFTEDYREYIRIINGQKKKQKFEYLTPELLSEHTTLSIGEMASDCMIFGLRKTKGISIGDFTQRFGYAPSERWPSQIESSIQRGLLEQTDRDIRLTRRAVVIGNEVFVHFLD